MDTNSTIPAEEKVYLRDLAKKQLEYANSPVMAERQRLWVLHNRLEGKRPMVVMEENTFIDEILPPMRCKHPLAACMERELAHVITAYELFDDDKVVPNFFPVYFAISMNFLGLKQKRIKATEGVGFHIEPVFETLEEGLPMLQSSEFIYHKEETEAYENASQDILGDILPITRKNVFNYWSIVPTYHVVNLMGMENMYCSMMMEPEHFHKLMFLITEDLIRCFRWQEENKLLPLNNGNDYMGSGSYCFSDELGVADSQKIRSKDTWGHLNSQESIGISPEQFNEFIYPYYEKLAREFGLVYYGCCEPVNAYWDKSLSHLPNLRKISISPWCDEEFMAERLAHSKVIYSRKPSPNFIGIKAEFDEEAFSSYIRKTASVLKGLCKAEFIFRDIYSLHGNLGKIRQAVEITRGIAETMY